MKSFAAAALLVPLIALHPPALAAVEAAQAADRMQPRADWDRAVEELADSFERKYVFPDRARSVAAALRGQKARLLQEPDPATFAGAVRKLVNDQLKDVHLYFAHDPATHARLSGEQDDAPASGSDAADESASHGFSKVEMLAGAIGLLQLDRMAEVTATSGAKAVAAMAMLDGADAVIIDLRRNGGGSGRMNQLLSSYFFEETVDKWLVSNENRSAGSFVQEWTQPYVPGKRIPKAPLYILTSPQTGSAAEGFAYNLQALGRAEVVGEKTAGGAHSGDFLPITGGFVAFVPSGRTINPITKSNWEGTGVRPDVDVPWSRALSAALRQIWRKRAADAPAGSPEAELARWNADYYDAKVEPVQLPPSIDALTGAYQDMDISRIGDTLYQSRKKGPLRPLLPLANGDFVVEASDYYGPGSSRLRFVRDSAGEVILLQELIRAQPHKVTTFDQPRTR